MSLSTELWLASGGVALPALMGALLLAFPATARRAQALSMAGSAGSLLLVVWLLEARSSRAVARPTAAGRHQLPR